jgi:hypothetical protein
MKKLIVSIGLFLAACGGITAREQVQIRAANDLRCTTSQVQTTVVDDKTIRANGCGQEMTYTEECEGGATHCNWRPQSGNTAGTPSATPAQ